jgi:hypothetical protein
MNNKWTENGYRNNTSLPKQSNGNGSRASIISNWTRACSPRQTHSATSESYIKPDNHLHNPTYTNRALSSVTVCSFSPSIYAQGECFLMRRNCNCNCSTQQQVYIIQAPNYTHASCCLHLSIHSYPPPLTINPTKPMEATLAA